MAGGRRRVQSDGCSIRSVDGLSRLRDAPAQRLWLEKTGRTGGRPLLQASLMKPLIIKTNRLVCVGVSTQTQAGCVFLRSLVHIVPTNSACCLRLVGSEKDGVNAAL